MAIPTNGLVFYAPLAEDKATAETGQTLTKTGTVNTLKINNIPCSLFASENSNLYANYSGGAFNGTISLWLYATDNTRSDTTDYGGFFMLGDFGNFSFIKGCMNTSAENSFSFGSSNINSSHCYPSTTIIRNEWVHLCFVVSGTSYSIYKNGILASQATAASAITLPDETTLYINNSEVGGIENIAIAACRVYNRALADSEIQELSKEFADEGTSGGTGVVIDGLFLSTSKPTANQKGLLVNNKFFIPFAESSGSGDTSAFESDAMAIIGTPTEEGGDIEPISQKYMTVTSTDDVGCGVGIEFTGTIQIVEDGVATLYTTSPISNIALRNATVYGDNITYFNCGSTNLASVDPSHNDQLVTLICSNGYLTALDISNNSLLTTLEANSNNLSSAVVDKILSDLVAHGKSNGLLRLENSAGIGAASNGAPTSQNNVTTLQSRGWTVTTA